MLRRGEAPRLPSPSARLTRGRDMRAAGLGWAAFGPDWTPCFPDSLVSTVQPGTDGRRVVVRVARLRRGRAREAERVTFIRRAIAITITKTKTK